MKVDLLPIFEQLQSERNIDRKVLIEAIRSAIETASKKSFENYGLIEIDFDENKWDFRVYQKKQVVERVENPKTEVTLDAARALDPKAGVGDFVRIEIAPGNFGRIAAQTAKQVIIQKLKEAERKNIFAEFKKREGDIIAGVVKKQAHGSVIVDLGKAEGVLPAKEQSPRDIYRFGQRMKFHVQEVSESERGSQIILSRAAPELVRHLFEMEVPEVYDGIVEIRSLAREPGYRSKIAVVSHDTNVDAVGACVGMKGMRVRTIVDELRGEKIDVIKWSEDIKTFVANALSPATISNIIIDEKTKSILVTVPTDQLSIAIGKRGQNARLASKLTAWKVDVIDEKRLKEETALFESDIIDELMELPGVGEKTAQILREAGYLNCRKIANASIEDIAALPGIGRKTAERLIESAAARLASPNQDDGEEILNE
ncbi:MAG: transcription termination/antitermination protein NusA [Candidatus Abyssobacteria bacterium SURF_5]|uniref:Transcription termination/antitermination protein NusA n=1 Tax=Abyssobacteria bacterium (strain SURF_5) TaxID=2093360 RepID=A0A3A4NW62_ABYX5|nr:MAG: transcription termination/antitermination protein NusA [Candidatus Abyssubacteria bacterium SURF_5]